jgi:hypothetical protein
VAEAKKAKVARLEVGNHQRRQSQPVVEAQEDRVVVKKLEGARIPMGLAKNRKSGFALTEIIVASSIAMLSLVALVGTSSLSTRITAKVSSGITTVSKASGAYEKICSDIRGSQYVLARYPSSGPPQFATNATNTLILMSPKSSGGNVIAGQFDIIIYYLAPITGDRGPNVLKRYKATSISGSEPTAVLDSELAGNISELSFVYSAHETFYQSDAFRKYRLRTTPTGDHALSEQRATMDGIELIDAGTASYVGNELVFSVIPPWGKLIDAYYNVNPADVVTVSSGNNVFEVLVSMKAQPKWRDQRQVEQTRELSLISRVGLRNR